MTGPASKHLMETLRAVGDALGVDRCWLYDGRYHFATGAEGWTVAVSPESAGRFRVEPCRFNRPVDTKWTAGHDRERLTRLVLEARDEVMAAA